MGNLNDYKGLFADGQAEVRRVRAARDEALVKLEPHRGSRYYAEHARIVEDEFRRDLEAAHTSFWAGIGPVLQAMFDAADKIDSAPVPPTDDQLRLLEGLKLAGPMTYAEFLGYREVCKSSPVALKALHELAKGSDWFASMPAPLQRADQARNMVKELRVEARKLANWDGTPRADAVRAFHAQATQGVPLLGRGQSLSNSSVDSDDPTSEAFFRDAIGMIYDAEMLALLD